MERKVSKFLLRTGYLLIAFHALALPQMKRGASSHDQRMQWWREARFGMFIHWGLYALPAGAWKGRTDYGEWIRNNAEIPIEIYDTLRAHFNPVRFDAAKWARAARLAGMKYVVLTSKHHDGFCLFDSDLTDFDVMSTPFRRDVVRELSLACRSEGLKFGLYYSIMDWHHPHYLPRRSWEKDRPSEGADYDRYVTYMKEQLKHLLTDYGRIDILWFDGEWEATWNDGRGSDLYQYVRSLQPEIIINNRVGAAREGMAGTTPEGRFGGDFGTPEQQVPSTGMPGVDWESCMTMNENWGFNRADTNFKPATQLIRTLVDIASKGGNYLLNVGPKADGSFPEESVSRLKEIGSWMNVNGESIYGTSASLFGSLPWGRSTVRRSPGGVTVYVHVFDWPSDGRLMLPGLFSNPRRLILLSDQGESPCASERYEDALAIRLPDDPPSDIASVLKLDFESEPVIVHAPTISSNRRIFLDTLHVVVGPVHAGISVRYTLDGSIPNISSPETGGTIILESSSRVTARYFDAEYPVSPTASVSFTKVLPREPETVTDLVPGLTYAYYEGEWDKIPDFRSMTPVLNGLVSSVTLDPRREEERFGFVFEGYVRAWETAIYELTLASDDGSRLWIGDRLLIDNDGLHGMKEQKGAVGLKEGFHPLRIEYFERTGGDGLRVGISTRNQSAIPLGAQHVYTHR